MADDKHSQDHEAATDVAWPAPDLRFKDRQQANDLAVDTAKAKLLLHLATFRGWTTVDYTGEQIAPLLAWHDHPEIRRALDDVSAPTLGYPETSPRWRSDDLED